MENKEQNNIINLLNDIFEASGGRMKSMPMSEEERREVSEYIQKKKNGTYEENGKVIWL